MQSIAGLQLRAVFSHTFSAIMWHIICHINKVNKISWLYRDGLVTRYYHIHNIFHFLTYIFCRSVGSSVAASAVGMEQYINTIKMVTSRKEVFLFRFHLQLQLLQQPLLLLFQLLLEQQKQFSSILGYTQLYCSGQSISTRMTLTIK